MSYYVTDAGILPAAQQMCNAVISTPTEADVAGAARLLRQLLPREARHPRYRTDILGRVIRNPGRRPLLHNGRKGRG